MKDKILTLIVITIITVAAACFVYTKLSETGDLQEYSDGLKEYNAEHYHSAYKHFGKISVFSSIKTPALFRQARCATLLGDTRGAKRNYTLLLLLYPHSKLYVVSEYNLAMLLYDMGNKSARKHFVHIIKYYPDTDYALASEYYVASIDMEAAKNTKIYWLRTDLKHKALNHFIRYVKLSPDGRFVQKSINKIGKLGIAITDNDSLALADSYFKRGLYNDASPFYTESPINLSWAKYAKNEFKRGNYPTAKLLAENGLRYHSSSVKKRDMYDAIDEYVKLSDDKPATVNYLLNKYPKSKGADYLLYLKAKYSDESVRYSIYEKLYDKYPNSSFSAEALYKTFYYQIDKKQYDKAIRLGQKHISHFKKSDTSPAVLFWMGKIYERKNNQQMARSYYKSVISRYPDSYYSYRAYVILSKNKDLFLSPNVNIKPIEFPCTDKNAQDMATKLIELGDYDFVSELYKDDNFVKSWIAYKRGKHVQSVIYAQKAMKGLYPKPKFDDPKWRLVYPLHYFKYIDKYKGAQDPLMILSIVREESHFDSGIVSPVGAVGLMQLMPATANEIASAYGISNNLTDPETNIRLGSLYYSKMKNSLWNIDAYAIMAYNGGWFSVVNWTKNLKYEDIDDFVEKIPYPETQTYVKKVLKSYWCYSNIY
ncbi:MAG: transglycosylase SLT domain-containing protein [Cyanobacteria bacterium RUI128]|nr:transglycosylase SLT domain-containing protein [Cyanobacteria bacterium RUI128]